MSIATTVCAYDFKGVSIGASEAELVALTPGIKCGASKIADRSCEVFNGQPMKYGGLPMAPAQYFTYGPTTLLNYTAEFFDGKLAYVQLEFPHVSYGDMVPALTVKFGPPTARRVAKLQNRMGATIEGVEYTWSADGQLVELEEYLGDINTSVIRIRTADFWAKVAAKKKERAKGQTGTM